MKEEILNKLNDPKFYLENFCQIKSKKGGMIPFILNEAQKDLFNALRNHRRIIVLKARQLGFSTAVSGWIYHTTIMNPGVTSALIGYNSDLVSELLDKIKTFYRTTPKGLRPTIKYDTKYEISFPKMDSKIMILPSTENVGSGYTLHNVLLTELPKIEKPEEKMASLLPAIPITGKLVIESSPKGMGNLFHRMWVNDNEYLKKEYGWWWGYSEEEIAKIKADINDPQIFAQEYELTFLSSGRPVFDMNLLIKQRQNILQVGDIVPLPNGEKHMVYEDDGWRFYKQPTFGGIYACGGDVSEGIMGGDYSVAIIWDRRNGEEVAMYRGHIPPDRFAETLNKVGRKYNNALMVIESNSHGLTTITKLFKDLVYPSPYFRQDKLEGVSLSFSEKLGWKTSKVTRPRMIDDFAAALRENSLLIHSKELLDEMTIMVYDDNGDIVAQSGFHDDCVFAACIGFQGFKVLYGKELSQLNYHNYLPKTFAY